MPISHMLLALVVVLVWGVNFIFVKLGLHDIPPLLLCTIRFFLAAFPAVLVLKPPTASFRLVALYGIVMFAIQFALVFLGINAGMTPGMASVVIQVQVFFSMFFAATLLGERPYFFQSIGALVSFLGIIVVAMHVEKDSSFLGFILILAAAATWGLGNLITKKIRNVNMMSLVVWGSFYACFPMLIISLIFEGPGNFIKCYHNISLIGVISVLYIVYLSTWVGYGIWNWLLSRYPVSTVAPFTLLVPIIGILSSSVVIGEPLTLWKLEAGLLVICGVAINSLGARYLMTRREPKVNELNLAPD